MTNTKLYQVVTETFARFEYKADKGEDWRFMDNVGKVVGDCEDFSLTVIRMYFGSMRKAIKALWSGEAVMWRCVAQGEGHAVGQIGDLFFDNSGRVYESQKAMRHVAPGSWRKFSRLGLIRKFYPWLVYALAMLSAVVTVIVLS